jgi:heat shock protein HslJ
MRRRRIVLVACVASVLVLGSCGHQTHGSRAQPNPDGHAYAAIGATGFVLPAGAAVRVVFDGFSVHVSGVCSTMSGDYTITAELLVVPSLSRTEVACASVSSMQVDDHLARLLRSSPRVQLDGELLTLSSGATSVQFRETSAAADLPLEGTLWTVVGVGNGDTVTHDNSLQPATLRLHDGVLDLFAGCNIGTAKAVVRANDVQISGLTLGKKSCPAPQLQLEFAVVLALSGTVTVRVEGQSLVIASGAHGLVAEGTPG